MKFFSLAPLKRVSLLAMFCYFCVFQTQHAFSAPTMTMDEVLIVNPGGTTIFGGFTWNSQLLFRGTGWQPNEEVRVHLYGPLNTLGVSPTDRVLPNQFLHTPTFKANASGDLIGILIIPYDGAVTGQQGQNMPDIPRPGRYEIFAEGGGPAETDRASAGQFNLHPETRPTRLAPNWAQSRGARGGWLGDQSPEMLDPEWVSVWDERPVGIYATVKETDDDGNNQPMLVAHHDIPSTHYGHDFNLHLLPDEEYRWVLGTANFADEDPDEREVGRLEFEWEVQNNGRPFHGSYHTGNIGMPMWAMATVNDRVYTVGRWPMDNGHPEEGLRTEIHPARLLATMRNLQTVVPLGASGCLTRAKQVDVYVSGHGGGINVFPDGLSEALNNNGKGGGRIQDVLTAAEQDLYYRFGPADSTLVDAIAFLVGPSNVEIHETAGPSAFGWGNGPEERPINDMNYDFDVPLPAPPADATEVLVQIETHPEHTTAVNEVITYTDPDPATGLPRKAHIHLPYQGADNGIYGRTLKFYWNTYNQPGRHFVVTMNAVTFFMPKSFSGIAYLWGDVGGQWFSFTDYNPDRLLHAGDTLGTSGLEGLKFDVYVDPTDKVRVYSYGYDQQALDSMFGVDVGIPAYEEALHILGAYADGQISLNPNTGDSEKLGGVFWEGNPIPTLPGAGGIRGPHARISDPFFHALEFTISYVPTPHLKVDGAPANFGNVCAGTAAETTIRISNAAIGLQNNDPYANAGVDTMHVAVSLTGTGMSFPPGTPTTYEIIAGQFVDVPVRFAPTAPGQSPGSITVTSDDPCHLSETFSFCGTSVSTGIRVLVVKPDGTPYSTVDQIVLHGNSSVTPSLNLKNVPLIVAQNGDCGSFAYHYQAALSPTNPAGTAKTYSLRARIGTAAKTVDFTLADCEFREITIVLP